MIGHNNAMICYTSFSILRQGAEATEVDLLIVNIDINIVYNSCKKECETTQPFKRNCLIFSFYDVSFSFVFRLFILAHLLTLQYSINAVIFLCTSVN